MKILKAVEDLQKFYTIRALIMNWMYGEKNGRMTGTPGGLCCHIILLQGFKVVYRIYPLRLFCSEPSKV
jgi:hypothetical protein